MKLRQLSSKTFPFVEGNVLVSAATTGRKEEENGKKKKVPSYLSDRTDEVVIFWRALFVWKAEERIEGHKSSGLNAEALERMRGSRSWSQGTRGAQPCGKQPCCSSGLICDHL